MPRVTIAIAQKQGLCINSNNVCASATTMIQPVVRQQLIERRRWRIARQMWLEDKRWHWCNKWGVASWDNQMAKKKSRQSCEAESAAVPQQSSWRSTKRTRGGGGMT